MKTRKPYSHEQEIGIPFFMLHCPPPPIHHLIPPPFPIAVVRPSLCPGYFILCTTAKPTLTLTPQICVLKIKLPRVCQQNPKSPRKKEMKKSEGEQKEKRRR